MRKVDFIVYESALAAMERMQKRYLVYISLLIIYLVRVLKS